MKKNPKVVFLTRFESGSCYIAMHLAKSSKLDLLAILLESRSKGQLQLLSKKIKKHYKKKGFWGAILFILGLPYIFLQDRKLTQRQKKALWNSGDFCMPSDILKYDYENLNTVAVKECLQQINPDIIVVYGTRILSRQTYDNAKIATVNIHMGITPEYRGSKSEFWALYNKDYKNIGLTVHKIDDGIDTGNVLAQNHVKLEKSDDECTLRIKNIIDAVPLIERVVRDLYNGKQEEIETKFRCSHFYSTPRPMQYIKLHRRLYFERKKHDK